ncbi:MAG: hypothetical protein GX443_17090 [Deltaproteobacteria bacterium]|nr:hypothetical protein [Deltaproteobacteria bacterium]
MDHTIADIMGQPASQHPLKVGTSNILQRSPQDLFSFIAQRPRLMKTL